MSTYRTLLSDVLINSLVSDLAVDLALHHRRTIIVFDVAFPASFIHEADIIRLVLLKALFFEVIDCVAEIS